MFRSIITCETVSKVAINEVIKLFTNLCRIMGLADIEVIKFSIERTLLRVLNVVLWNFK